MTEVINADDQQSSQSTFSTRTDAIFNRQIPCGGRSCPSCNRCIDWYRHKNEWKLRLDATCLRHTNIDRRIAYDFSMNFVYLVNGYCPNGSREVTNLREHLEAPNNLDFYIATQQLQSVQHNDCHHYDSKDELVKQYIDNASRTLHRVDTITFNLIRDFNLECDRNRNLYPSHLSRNKENFRNRHIRQRSPTVHKFTVWCDCESDPL